MGKGSKIFAYESIGSGTGIFYKRGYGEGHRRTLSIWYPLSSIRTHKLSYNF